jgi:hypothetical protein
VTETLLITDLIVGMLIISGISMAGLGVYSRRFADRIPAAVPYTLLMHDKYITSVCNVSTRTVGLPEVVVYGIGFSPG